MTSCQGECYANFGRNMVRAVRTANQVEEAIDGRRRADRSRVPWGVLAGLGVLVILTAAAAAQANECVRSCAA